MKRALIIGVALLVVVGSLSCEVEQEEPVALGEADRSGGPAVQFDAEAHPFPDTPFPNDYFTAVDETSPTGIRVDLPGATEGYAEARVRGELNSRAGFGVFSPVSVSFDQPLDVESLVDRHQKPTPDFSDDAVLLVNVDPMSADYGEFQLLDMGLGNYPVTLSRPDGYYDHDPKSDGTNLLFPSADHHGGEVNLLEPGADPYEPGQLLEFYERETNTLIMRPVRPLQPETKYAVVLTEELRGENGLPVDSPFEWVNDPKQTDDLSALRRILPKQLPQRFDGELDNVRFAWSFTTGSPGESLREIRAGLYGEGPMAELSDVFRPRLHMIHDVKGTGEEPLTFELDELIEEILPLAGGEFGDVATDAIEESLGGVDYFVSGSFLSPSFLGQDDGLAHGDAAFDDLAFEIDTRRGTKRIQPVEVPFICAIPEPIGATQRPYPVIIYSHAIGSMRFEALGFAGTMAKFGFATCTVESPAHGVDVPSEHELTIENVANNYELHNLPGVIDTQRARDLSNDGDPDSGGDYFTADLVQTRNMIRQTTIDQMQLIRILRSYDGDRHFAHFGEGVDYESEHADLAAGWDQRGNGRAEVAGDFSGDGVVDLGGDRPYVTWGTSLGGIQSSILAGVDPVVVAGASNAGGAGLIDIAMRSTNNHVRSSVMLRLMGPVLVGEPTGDGEATRLRWVLPEDTGVRRVHLAEVPLLEDGQRVVVRNPAREQVDVLSPDQTRGEAVVEDGVFRLGVPAEAQPPAARRVELGFDPEVELWEAVDPDVDPDQLPDDLVDDYERRIVDDATRFGDPLVVEIYDADGERVETIDSFPEDTVDAGILYPAGTPLAALSEGWGLERQTPEIRRFFEIGQLLMEPVDPVMWASKYHDHPDVYDYESEVFRRGDTNFLSVGTLGDQVVPINASIAIARAAGAVDTLKADPDYGVPENQMLIDEFVYEGIAELDRFPDYPNTLFDPDDLDDGLWRPDGQQELEGPVKPVASPPLRATKTTDNGIQALRLGYLDRTGEHTFNLPEPDSPFDMPSFLTNQVGWFLAGGGREISDDHCQEELAMTECAFFDVEEFKNPL